MSDILTFGDLKNRFARWVDDDSTTTETLIEDAINASIRRLLTSSRWSFMRWPRMESFTTTAGVTDYPLKSGMGQMVFLWDNQRKQQVPIIPTREFDGQAIDLTSPNTSYPAGVIFGPEWPVSAQPTSPSTLSCVSSQTGDVAVTVFIRGFDTNGDLVEETVTVNGTTPTVTTNTFRSISNVTKTSAWTGTLTITSNSGAVTCLSLVASAYGRSYPTVRFTEPPTGGLVYSFTGFRYPRILTSDNDIPETPYPFSEFHVYDALLDYTSYNTELGQKEQALWKLRAEELKTSLLNRYDEAIAGSQPRFVRDLNGSGRRVNLVPLS